MLATLRIRNLALVPDLTLELQPGLNVLTGETGAGKSVILGAIQLAIGQRADRGAIRAGSDLCSVEAVFHPSRCQAAVDQVLAEAGIEPCDAGTLVIRRSIGANGVNRQFVNGSPTTLATLASIGQCLVDLHGPHDHQSLLQPARQLDILDAFGSLLGLRKALAQLVARRDQLHLELRSLLGNDAGTDERCQLLAHQIREIEDARLQPGEETSLAAEHSRAANAARLIDLSMTVTAALAEDDDGLSCRLSLLARTLQEMARLDPSVGGILESHRAAASAIRDLHQAVERHAHAIVLDPEHLATVSERLNLVQSLRRKYGNTIEDILAYAAKAREDQARLEGRREHAIRIEAEIAAVEAQIEDAGTRLRRQRQDVLPRLAQGAASEFASLGFMQSGFEVSLSAASGHDTPATAMASGMDHCEFLFAPNPGEPHRPLRSIASSGELARVMLGLKSVLAREDPVPVLVFDEVDANVGGETAHAVGRSLRRIARDHQVLCITHLAPVAAHAQAHYLVTKDLRDGRTESCVRILDDSGRTRELGRMLGGGAAALHHATELLKATRLQK